MRVLVVSGLVLSGCRACDDVSASSDPGPIVRWDAGPRRAYRPRALPLRDGAVDRAGPSDE